MKYPKGFTRLDLAMLVLILFAIIGVVIGHLQSKNGKEKQSSETKHEQRN